MIKYSRNCNDNKNTQRAGEGLFETDQKQHIKSTSTTVPISFESISIIAQHNPSEPASAGPTS